MEHLTRNELNQNYYIRTIFLQTSQMYKCIPKERLDKLKNGINIVLYMINTLIDFNIKPL